jgi:hypothetical protein
MTVRHGRLAVLAIGIASLLAMLSGGVANAAPAEITGGVSHSVPARMLPGTMPGYAWNDGGPFQDLATCNAQSAAENDPPTIYTFPCGYYQGDPIPPGPSGPGYYYLVEYSII